MKKTIWGFLFAFFWMIQGFSQETTVRQERLLLELDYTGFFKNNEFFAQQADGHTLTGNHITPLLKYQLGNRALFSAGGHLRYFHGMDSLAEAAPFFNLHLKPNKAFSLILGSYRVLDQHRVSRALLSDERRFTDYTEEGLRVRVNHDKLWMDAWIDWEKFIWHGDPFREQFQAGFSGEWTFLELPSISLSMSSQWMAGHKGGQIDDTERPVSTVLNTHHRLVFHHDFPPGFLNYGEISAGYFTYRDINGNAPWAYDEGHAMQAEIELNLDPHSFAFGYFEAEKFIAPQGHPMFQTSNLYEPRKHFQELKMVHAGYNYSKQFYEGLMVSFVAEGFYLTQQESLHHSFELRAVLSRSFLLKAFGE